MAYVILMLLFSGLFWITVLEAGIKVALFGWFVGVSLCLIIIVSVFGIIEK